MNTRRALSLADWMGRCGSAIGARTVAELSLPGSHDSGCYDMISRLGRSLTQTQSLSLFGQLSAGARALDLRVGLQPERHDHDRYVLVHGSFRTRVNLNGALCQVEAFVHRHPQEIIVLDIHRVRLLRADDHVPTAELQALIRKRIGHLLIPPEQRDATLSELWRSPERRVIVALHGTDRDERWFWPGIRHHWYNTHNVQTLRARIAADLAQPRPRGLWSICAVMTPQPNISIVKDWLTGIPSLAHYVERWFQIDAWAARANIISVDWFGQGGLARSCAMTNALPRG